MTAAGAPGRRRVTQLLRETALSLGALAGVVCLLAAAGAAVFDLRLVVFGSGSMSPAIETGALALARTTPAADLAVGDVVTVFAEDGSRVTHRIRDLRVADGEATLVLQGDANPTPDDEVYVASEADRILLDLPGAGYAVNWLSGPAGTFGGGALVAGALVIAFSRRTPGAPAVTDHGDNEAADEPDPAAGSRPRGHPQVVGALGVVGIAVGVGLTLLPAPHQTQAYYSDSASAISGGFTKASSPTAPVVTGCAASSGNSSTRISWTAATDPTTFEIRYVDASIATQTVAGSLRQVDLAAKLNNTSGSFHLVAVDANGTSLTSNPVTYSSNGNVRTCTVG